MDYELDRDPAIQPSLSQMLGKALEMLGGGGGGEGHEKTRLNHHGPGFFLMVEGSRIDMAAHTNDPAAHIKEILAYNDAVSEAIAYVSSMSSSVTNSCLSHNPLTQPD